MIINNKKYIEEIKNKEINYNEIKKQNDILKEENIKLIEIKQGLNNNNDNDDINKKFFVELDESQMEKEEEINKLKMRKKIKRKK